MNVDSARACHADYRLIGSGHASDAFVTSAQHPLPVLIWYWGRRGGGARFTYELACALAREPGVAVACSLSAQNELLPTFRAANFPVHTAATYRNVRDFLTATLSFAEVRSAFREHLCRVAPRVVISTMPHVWSPLLYGRVHEAGAKLISIEHDAVPHPGDPRLSHRLALRASLARADAIVTLSEAVARQLRSAHALKRERLVVLEHGAFGPLGEAAPLRPRRYPRGRPFRFLAFGRIRSYKGIDLLLAAFRRLWADPARQSPIELHIVGWGNLAPWRRDIARLQSEGCPIVVDNRWVPEDEISEILADKDALVVSHTEASQSGVVALGLGHCVPAVVTPVGGLARQVTDGVTAGATAGLVAEAVDAEALATAMRRLLEEPRLYESLSAGARVRALEQAGWAAQAVSLAALARRLAGQSP